jgi:O-antigen ligase
LWPALLISLTPTEKARATATSAALAALVAVTTLLSSHAASQIAIAGAGIVYLLHCLNPALARRLVVCGWLAAMTLVLPAVHAAHRADLHLNAWLPENGRARIAIWTVTAERYVKSPWLGIGAGSTQRVTDQLRAARYWNGEELGKDTDAHAHNIYLQTWYELGIVGAVFLLAVGLSVMRWVWAQPLLTQRFLLAAFVSASVIAAFSWGVWQPWFMASLLFCSIVAILAARRRRGVAAPPKSAS